MFTHYRPRTIKEQIDFALSQVDDNSVIEAFELTQAEYDSFTEEIDWPEAFPCEKYKGVEISIYNQVPCTQENLDKIKKQLEKLAADQEPVEYPEKIQTLLNGISTRQKKASKK